VILVEGLFDYQNVTCSLGAHLNTHSFGNSAMDLELSTWPLI